MIERGSGSIFRKRILGSCSRLEVIFKDFGYKVLATVHLFSAEKCSTCFIFYT
jgi:hypothetical protein